MLQKNIPDHLTILRHSLAHIMATAVLKLFPEAKFAIGPAIENGFYYDFDLPRTLIPEDLPLIEEEMKKIIQANYSFEQVKVPVKKALTDFTQLKQPYKVELIEELASNSQEVTLYKSGNFVDLCRGPHLDSTGEIPSDAFKLTKIAGAYWKGSEKNKMLQRIYGVAFETKKELQKYLQMIEEAKKRDHRKLGKELEFFMISEEVGKGLPLWLPKGAFIRKKLEDYMYELERKNGYDFVYTPILAHENLYKKSGHLAHYREDMYNPIEIEEENYYLKPMNCPHHHMIYKNKKMSYRDLPLRLADFSPIHRFERSGVLSGLIRARTFSQNDAHIYCSKNQVEEELIKVIQLFKKVYQDFQIKDYWFRFSLPDFEDSEKYGDIKNKDLWDLSTQYVRNALKNSHEKFVEAKGEAAFYGPKIDVQIKNVFGKEDSIATIQVDLYSPERFDIEFINSEGKKERPIIIHRAIMGSFDRFFAFLVEKYAGAFPLWLAPIQATIIPVSEKFLTYAQEIKKQLITSDIRTNVNNHSDSLGKRIQETEKQKVPYILIVGEKEQASKTVTLRPRNNKKQETLTLTTFINKLQKEIADKQ